MSPAPSSLTEQTLASAGLLQSPDFLVQNLQRLDVSARQAILCRHGNPFRPEIGQNLSIDVMLRFYLDGRFIGVGQVGLDGKELEIQPVRLVSTENS